jgi:putative phosphoribosyl transferase
MFRDRRDAAEQLGQALEKYRNSNPLVLGIPRGGAETAYYVAKYLNAEMSVVVTRKLGYPSDPEFAFGAIAEDGSLYLSDHASTKLSQEEMNHVINSQKEEIKRRIKLLRNGEDLPNLKGRTVILVDDGIATGSTLFASIMLCQNKGASRLIVASPIAGEDMFERLFRMVDEVVILESPPFYRAVSQGYASFKNLTDEEALEFMKKWKAEHSS